MTLPATWFRIRRGSVASMRFDALNRLSMRKYIVDAPGRRVKGFNNSLICGLDEVAEANAPALGTAVTLTFALQA